MKVSSVLQNKPKNKPTYANGTQVVSMSMLSFHFYHKTALRVLARSSSRHRLSVGCTKNPFCT